ncbi:MAG: hypothetical protein MZV63_41880 [Marinilabiliales bacterium]|nr:hypothetical protein [Marinilabiliales bacterium]
MRQKWLIDGLGFVLILAMSESNSYAAATEIKAYLQLKQYWINLINIDTEENLCLIN